VALPEWTGFAADASAAKIAVRAETRLEIFYRGRGRQPSRLFVVQLSAGSSVIMSPPSLAPRQRTLLVAPSKSGNSKSPASKPTLAPA